MMLDMSEKEILIYNEKHGKQSKLIFLEQYDGLIIKEID